LDEFRKQIKDLQEQYTIDDIDEVIEKLKKEEV